MRVTGYCTGCRRVRNVSASGHALAMARGGVVQGTCADCERREDDVRRAHAVAPRFLGRPVVLTLWHGPPVEGVLTRVDDAGGLVVVADGRELPAVPIRDVRHVTKPKEDT